ncbi:MAG: hypothetical protein EXR39_11660 [Betaproteobacteria bacterium]|nr:hypothetical protein [Betaproteobacteria bacterium]
MGAANPGQPLHYCRGNSVVRCSRSRRALPHQPSAIHRIVDPRRRRRA